MDLGNDFGRKYDPDIWINKFDHTFQKLNCQALIATDTRFRREFDYLKKLDFLQIRIIRQQEKQINDVSETNQEQIQDIEFDCLINNSGSKRELKKTVKQFLAIHFHD